MIGKLVVVCLLGGLLWTPRARAAEADLAGLFAERVPVVVSVSYVIEREIDRQRNDVVGLVVDEQGLVVLQSNAIPDWLPLERLTELRVHVANSTGEGYAAEYLGPDYLNGWHYLRAEESAWAEMKSIRQFPPAKPRQGEELWGICLTDENLDYLPYLRNGRLSAVQAFPLLTGFLTADVVTPGGPVFDFSGSFVGWGGQANPVERDLWIGGEVYRVNIRNTSESHAFLLAEDFLRFLDRVPAAPAGGARPWLGLAGLRPLDPETAAFLGLEDQGAVVVSEVLADSPAAAAGFEPRDIVVAVDGERLPRFKPEAVVQTYLERAIRGSAVGATMAFTVVRGEDEVGLEATLVDGPKPVREAERFYYEGLGLTIRELVLSDALARRVDVEGMEGVFAAFVKPNSAPGTAGLEPGDWILEIDGVPVDSFETAREAFDRIAADDSPEREYVLLVSRNNETAVLRVRQD